MLSIKMVNVLLDVPFSSTQFTINYRDGRTVRALQNRSLITKVEWNQSLGEYTFRLTKKGKVLSRGLRYIDRSSLKGLLA